MWLKRMLKNLSCVCDLEAELTEVGGLVRVYCTKCNFEYAGCRGDVMLEHLLSIMAKQKDKKDKDRLKHRKEVTPETTKDVIRKYVKMWVRRNHLSYDVEITDEMIDEIVEDIFAQNPIIPESCYVDIDVSTSCRRIVSDKINTGGTINVGI